jgi:pimeloyl-ACP methyl ester carboxylesterase
MEDLAALLDHLSIDRVNIVGLSMGAAMVVDFAIAHPERIHALVPVDGGPSGTSGPPPDVLAIFQTAAEGRLDEAREAWLAAPLFAPAMEQPEVASRIREMVADFGWWRNRNPGLAQALQPPAIAQLAQIAAPTLVVVGDRERPAVRAGCDALVSGIRGAKLVVLPGAGHMSNMEAPSAFNAAVLEFLSTL